LSSYLVVAVRSASSPGVIGVASAPGRRRVAAAAAVFLGLALAVALGTLALPALDLAAAVDAPQFTTAGQGHASSCGSGVVETVWH